MSCGFFVSKLFTVGVTGEHSATWKSFVKTFCYRRELVVVETSLLELQRRFSFLSCHNKPFESLQREPRNGAQSTLGQRGGDSWLGAGCRWCCYGNELLCDDVMWRITENPRQVGRLQRRPRRRNKREYFKLVDKAEISHGQFNNIVTRKVGVKDVLTSQ